MVPKLALILIIFPFYQGLPRTTSYYTRVKEEKQRDLKQLNGSASSKLVINYLCPWRSKRLGIPSGPLGGPGGCRPGPHPGRGLAAFPGIPSAPSHFVCLFVLSQRPPGTAFFLSDSAEFRLAKPSAPSQRTLPAPAPTTTLWAVWHLSRPRIYRPQAQAALSHPLAPALQPGPLGLPHVAL